MRKKWNIQRSIGFLVGVGFSLFLMATSVQADRMTSTNFVLNGNMNSSFGGQGNSTNYGMFSTGGEPVIGQGASGSYILGGGFTAQTERSISLTVQPGGLLGFWKFDEATGKQFVDSSSTRADGTMAGTNDGNFSSVSGKLGNALSSTAANDDSRILIPAGSIQPSSVTMEIWFNPSSLPNDGSWNSLCSYYGTPSEDWGPFEFYTDGSNGGNTILWVVQNGAVRSVNTSPNTISTGTWTHIVGTYDAASGVSKVYMNGVERGTGTFPAAALNYSVANAANKISCFNSGRWDGEGVIGALDHLKIFNRAMNAAEVKAEYDAQNASIPTGITLGSVTPGSSNTALQDVIVRTDSGEYGIVLSQDHNLQKGAQTIPAIGASIASPAAWSEGSTKGLGFTLMSAPGLDSKWGTGANYAAIPGSPTSFYTRNAHAGSDTIDVINGRLRLDTTTSQESGAYSNTVTYTGTTIP